MADRLNCVVQAGHVPRTRGATGANGLLGTEQQFTLKTATYIQKWLTLRGWTCEMIGADDDVPDSSVFVAIHHDGARSSKARGPSVGYPPGDDQSKRAAQEWKRSYGQAYPGPSFRPDNYTDGLKYYYGYRKTRASVKLVCEHGFGSNPEDARFMWSDAGQDAAVDAIEAVLGHWLGWDARLSPQEVHARLNPGAQPAPRTAAPVTLPPIAGTRMLYRMPGDPLMRGDDVRALQQILADAGYDPGPIDGIFGTGTETAVRDFQQAHGLAVDGIVGPRTWAELTRVPPDQTVPEGANAASTAAEPPAPIVPEAETPPPPPPAPVTPPVVAEPPGRQSPEAEPPPLPTEEMPVSEVKSKAGHTAWQASVATVVITSLEHLDGFDAAHLPDQAALTAAIATIATLASALKTWWQDRPGGGRHTS